jgi:hypothetical protein
MDMELTPTPTPTAATATPNSLPLVAGTVDALKHWLSTATRFEQGKLFSQVMAGLELKALWKASGLSQGKRTDLSQVGKSHDELCKEVGLSKTQAYRLMEMAEAALPRLKKLPELAGLDITATPLSALSESNAAALETAVRKLTDGKSQGDFFGDLGIYKKTTGAKGGASTAGASAELSDDARKEILVQQARDDFNEVETILLTSLAANFTLLSDQEVAAQIHQLQIHINARNTWLRTPKRNRDATAVARVRGLIDQQNREAMDKANRGEAVGEVPQEETVDAR